MIAKIHSHQGKMILAICDKELIGNLYEEGDRILDLSSSFYKGKDITEELAIQAVKKAYIINAAGKKTINFLSQIGLINEKDALTINKIPHIQIINPSLEN